MTLLTESLVFSKKFRKVDRVFAFIIALFVLLTAFLPMQSVTSLSFTLDALLKISPYLIISVLLAAFTKATSLDRQIATVFSGHPVRAIMMAAAFGALSPFCSCGVIPLIAGLLAAGVPLAPVMAFWMASPLMDPQMFFLMSPIFGLDFSLAKLISALAMGFSGGYLIHLMKTSTVFSHPMLVGGRFANRCGTPNILDKPSIILTFWKERDRRELFNYEIRTMGWFLLKWLTLAFLLESLMVAYLPAETIASNLGVSSWWAIPASVFLGIPTYLNGFAAIPTVSALVDMGMVPGAALGFMLAGGVTCIPAAVAVFALVKRPVFLFYVAWGLFTSLISAYSFQAYISLANN